MFLYLGIAFVSLLLTANVVGSKPLFILNTTIPAGLTIFPLTYLLGDIITELYGFKSSRRIIWLGLASNLFLALACKIAILIPSPPNWPHTEAYSTVLGINARLMVASVATYLIGEFINASLVAKLKTYFQGRFFFWRALGGNWLGEGVETALFIPLAFYDTLTKDQLFSLWQFCYLFKISYAMAMMPLTTLLTKYLKTKLANPAQQIT